MNERKTNTTSGTENYNLSTLSHENNDGVSALLNMGQGSREDLDPLDITLNKEEADKRGYARELSPEDYVDRTPAPLPEAERRTLGRTLLRIFGKKPS